LATVAVIGSGWLLSSNKTLPMLGTLARAFWPASRPPGRLRSGPEHAGQRAGGGSGSRPTEGRDVRWWEN
jgi:hypothetical protein